MDYIQPIIRFYDRFEELDGSEDTHYYFHDPVKWGDIFTKKRVLVLAEPGYGKTRMLKEIVITSSKPEHHKDAIFIDLKKVTDDIEKYVNNCTKDCKIAEILTTEDEIIEASLIKTQNFTLSNSDNIILCFDALDEVQVGDKFANLIDGLKLFSTKYPQCNIIISCRTHHYKRYSTTLSQSNFEFCKIFNFGNDNIRSFLEKMQDDSSKTKAVMSYISRTGYQTVLGTPRYLYMFSKLLIKSDNISDVKLNRTDLFEQFIYDKLEKENREDAKIDINITKRVLEKLALIMEIYQSNVLTKDELLTYFDRIDSNLSKAFLEKSNWKALMDKSLIKDNIDEIQFENREFQEYLAAKELVRIAKNEQALYDLVVDAELKETIPSWFNTLGFLVELDISKLKYFLEIGRHRNNSVQDVEYHRLLTNVRTDRLDIKEKREIFDFVFSYYEKECLWLDHDIAEKLAYYYDNSFFERFKAIFDEEETEKLNIKIKVINAIRVVMSLFEYKLSNDQDNLKNCLVKQIKARNDSSIKKEILYALREYGDFEVINSVIPECKIDDKDNLECLIGVLSDLNPDSEISLQYFIEGTKRGIISSRYGFYGIRNEMLIEQMIRSLIQDSKFLKGFLDMANFARDRDIALINNIKNAITPTLLDAIEDLIIFSYQSWHNEIHAMYNSQYIKELDIILVSKKPDSLFSILSKIKGGNLSLSHSRFDECFKERVNAQNVEQFIKEVESCNEGRQFAVNFFLGYYNDKPGISEKARQIYAQEFSEYEKKRKEYEDKHKAIQSTSFDVYSSFQDKLGMRDKYYADVFEFYIAHSNEIDATITPEEMYRLKSLVFDILGHNPLKGEVTVTQKDNSGCRSYSITTHIHLFGECLHIAKNKGWDLSDVKQNILNYVPFSVNQELEIIFDCIGDMKDLNIEPIIMAYTTRTDHLPVFMPGSFIRTCKRYNIISAVPILDAFIDNTNIMLQDRREALKILIKFKPDCTKLKSIFNKYKDNSTEKQLAETANELLMELNDTDAILWRIQEIKAKQVQVAPYINGKARSLSSEESELHTKWFAKPLLGVSNEKYIDQYRELLEHSFQKMEEDEKYSAYASYLWDIVCAYYSNLRFYRNYKPILELEKYIYQKAGEKGANWFKYRIQKLKREYSSYITKPADILICIQKYNNILNNTYLLLKNNQDLINFVKTAIDTHLLRFVEDEGFYREIERVKGHQEDMIQKTLLVKLENIFMKNGLRNSDIIREPQLLDDKRPDFKISYGFLGPILIEIKTSSNKEISQKSARANYKPKLQQYISGFSAVHAYFVIFQVSNQHPISKYRPHLDGLYCDCENVNVMYLNCIKNG